MRIKAGKTHASATRPRTAHAAAGGRRSASCGRGGGAREREPRRRRRGTSTAGGDALIPLNGLRAREKECSVWCCGAQGRRDVDAVRQRTTPSIFLNGRAADVCHSCGLRRIRLLSVSLRKEATKRHGEQRPRTWEARRASAAEEKCTGYGYLQKGGTRGEQRAGFDGVRLRSRIGERTLPVERVRKMIGRSLMFRVLRGREKRASEFCACGGGTVLESKRTSRSFSGDAGSPGFLGGGGIEVRLRAARYKAGTRGGARRGEPKKKARLDRMSSREGAMIAGWGIAGSVMVEASGGG